MENNGRESEPLFSLHTFCSIRWLLADSEGPDQTARMLEDTFLHGAIQLLKL